MMKSSGVHVINGPVSELRLCLNVQSRVLVFVFLSRCSSNHYVIIFISRNIKHSPSIVIIVQLTDILQSPWILHKVRRHSLGQTGGASDKPAKTNVRQCHVYLCQYLFKSSEQEENTQNYTISPCLLKFIFRAIGHRN